MSIAILVGDSVTYVPGVYSTFKVASSLPAPAPTARSIYIVGEADEGAPGNQLDIRGVYFTDLQEVKDVYTSGPLVDAARMIFSNQPSSVFAGAVQRLYVYKTNQSVRAFKDITSPAGYGKVVATRYGERGNQIKTQVKQSSSEQLPSKSGIWAPSEASVTMSVVIDGVQAAVASLSAEATADAAVAALAAVPGLSATGGTARTVLVSGPMTANASAAGDTLTVTRSTGSATFAAISLGDSAYISMTSSLSGTAHANAGTYLVTAISTTSMTLKQVKAADVNAAALVAVTAASVAAADLKINAPMTVAVSAPTAAGTGASLEILDASANRAAHGYMVAPSSFIKMVSAATAAVASMAVASSGNKLTLSISNGSFSQVPKVGDLIQIARTSSMAGATKKNVGILVVTASSALSITAEHLQSAMVTEAVSATSLAGSDTDVMMAPSFMSTDVAARKIVSSAESKVTLSAVRASDGLTMAPTLIGGNIVMELGYFMPGASACTVTIDQTRTMTITPVGAGSPISVKLTKYDTIQALVDFLNAMPGVTAAAATAQMKSASPASLDMITAAGCLSGQALSAANCRIKKDYSDWQQLFVNQSALLSFVVGTNPIQAGLPAPESAPSYLAGGVVGSTADSDIQSAMDEGLKVSVRMVVPLFSRDAVLDVADGLTDPASSYTIDSVHAATQSHVATASSNIQRQERFGLLSIDSDYETAKEKSATMAYERLQMTFERHTAQNAAGKVVKFLPWMAQCSMAAGRAQAAIGTSMLRKPFLLSSVEHTGDASLYSASLVQDFTAESRDQLEDAIIAGLLVFRAVPGFGVRLESPDLSTRSRDNDPTSWVYERVNVLMTCDEVISTTRSVLENYIGSRTSDVSTEVIKSSIKSTLDSFITSGALLSYTVTSVKSVGNGYTCEVIITPTEALESIVLNVLAERSI